MLEIRATASATPQPRLSHASFHPSVLPTALPPTAAYFLIIMQIAQKPLMQRSEMHKVSLCASRQAIIMLIAPRKLITFRTSLPLVLEGGSLGVCIPIRAAKCVRTAFGYLHTDTHQLLIDNPGAAVRRKKWSGPRWATSSGAC